MELNQKSNNEVFEGWWNLQALASLWQIAVPLYPRKAIQVTWELTQTLTHLLIMLKSNLLLQKDKKI
jgi:hypothetical protein